MLTRASAMRVLLRLPSASLQRLAPRGGFSSATTTASRLPGKSFQETSIGVPRETDAGERRVAATPETVAQLSKKGFKIYVRSCSWRAPPAFAARPRLRARARFAAALHHLPTRAPSRADRAWSRRRCAL